MDEIKAITKVIEDYLKVVKTGNGYRFVREDGRKDFDKAFHQDATIIDADNENWMTVSEFAAMVKGLIDQGLVVEERPQALTVGYNGNVANVRLDFELQIGNDLLYGTDFFNLVRKAKRWRISQKIYSVTRASKVP